jgi:hypothetical protein
MLPDDDAGIRFQCVAYAHLGDWEGARAAASNLATQAFELPSNLGPAGHRDVQRDAVAGRGEYLGQLNCGGTESR